MLIALALPLLAAQEPVHLGESIALESSILEEERTILVHTPPKTSEEERLDVVYVLDGEKNFQLTVAATELLARTNEGPEVIVVGIVSTHRLRDLTPQEDEEMPGSGESDTFLAFLRSELFPFVEESYRASEDRFLVGYEYGGLFALNTLVNTPNEFRGYVAISPALEFLDGVVLKRARYTFIRRPPAPRFLYTSLANETAPRAPQFEELERILKTVPRENADWHVDRFPDESPEASVLVATQRGLRTCFTRWAAAKKKE